METSAAVPGIHWFWYYKDALKTKSKIPSFQMDGKKQFFGLWRAKLDSSKAFSQPNSVGCIIFFPKADHTVDHFVNGLQNSLKSSVILDRYKQHIHVLIGCNSLEEFDKKTENMSTSISIWADVDGKVAEMFGMKPLLQVINVNDMFSETTDKKRQYSKQIISGFFITIGDTIVKSPAYQPKLQVPNLSNIKSSYESIVNANLNIEKVLQSDQFGSDLSEKELQMKQRKAWEQYEQEYDQMLIDLGKKQPPKKIEAATTVKKNAVQAKKPTTSSAASNKKAIKRPATANKQASKNILPNGNIKSKM